jgi:predicted DNA-binding transcriptional regulator AlpA
MNIPKLLTNEEAASLMGISPATLNTWRCTKRVIIPYRKVGRAVRYVEADILAYLDSVTK